MDAIVSFFGKVALAALIITMLVTVASVLQQYGEKNDYKQYVNLSIERFGGLTPAAIQDINQYSADHYDGRFSLKTEPSEKKPFGEVIAYSFDMKITPVFTDIELSTRSFDGHASSKVR